MDLLVENIYSARVQMLVVRSDDWPIEEWVIPERNIYEDYMHTFGKVPPGVAGIAIMTDTDNTGKRAIAHYGDIRLLHASHE